MTEEEREMRMRTTVVLAAMAVGVRAFAAAELPDCDVLVVGAGTAGTVAAIQSARAGARTVLVEQGFQPGGNMTTGGVNFPGLFHAWGKQVIDGVGYALVTNAVAMSGGTLPDFAYDPARRHWRYQIVVPIPLYVLLAEEAFDRSGVRVRYHSAPRSIESDGKGWRVVLSEMGEERTLRTKVVVDCTGNASAVALAGGERLRGPVTSPGTFAYRFDTHGPVSKADLAAAETAFRKAVADGELLETDKRWSLKTYLGHEQGMSFGNYVDGADNSTAERRTETNRRGRASVLRMFRFLRRQPGFERLELVSVAAETGVRETYRAKGDLTLTQEDYTDGRVFPDSLCYAFYPIDLHNTATGVQPRALAFGKVATVPLRALTVAGRRNLLVAGRCLSSDRLANAALRVEATCMATGQAAGEAAALAAKLDVDVREIPIGELKAKLRASGCIVP